MEKCPIMFVSYGNILSIKRKMGCVYIYVKPFMANGIFKLSCIYTVIQEFFSIKYNYFTFTQRNCYFVIIPQCSHKFTREEGCSELLEDQSLSSLSYLFSRSIKPISTKLDEKYLGLNWDAILFKFRIIHAPIEG